ncbi:Putative glycoside hydrolase family 16, concanavalin A-like lectin/glucanase domain superfamily [Septoria linicola]|uniref:endo-1,3(4)-beta-glucanase n=1 Tax=Septoria linicola TaxID=215465 RepID=A0A9Q9AZI5_9PEZI|nr:Putative glycoside hydrolase family 16, concanavalin A-like lectin/glucanase domain superfamily [Septoria linicola]
MLFSTLSTCFVLFSTTGWAGYVLQDDYFAQGFFDQFDFFDQPDPTNGFVSYKPQDEAWNAKLISNTSSNIIMGVDSDSVTPYGRNSVRITSKKAYSSGLIVVDIDHMPGGICGTWPAFWMVGPNWPNGGEIDMLEGVNDQTMNDVTLHTGPGCSITNNGGFSGELKYTGCASSGDNNTGCQIGATSTKTYGSGFNTNKGGVYATEWTSNYISVFFFPRGSVPDDVLGNSPQPSTWGTPIAKFSGDCDMASAFTDQQIVFDTTFCGDWAGKTWSSSSCSAKADTCNAFVENNPSAFKDAYWSVNALKVYQLGNSGATAPPPSTYAPTSTSPPLITPPVVSSYGHATSAQTTLATKSRGGYAPVVGSGGSVGYQPTVESKASTAKSPAETGTGYAPVVGSDGTIGHGGAQPAKASPTQGGGGAWWSTNADGSVGYSGHGWSHRHARHLARHKRHSGRRL